MEEGLLPDDSAEHSDMLYVSGAGGKGYSQNNGLFNISPQELTDIVNKYKERDENMQDIHYFSDKGGVAKLLTALGTDKNYGISSIDGREAHFGSNKVFRKPPPSFWDFVKEALGDKMIIILICCSIFEILI